MQTGIQIGADVRVAETVGKVILEILDSASDESSKVAALEALTKSLSVSNTNIANTTIIDGHGKE